jgi:hypothetical protein
VLKLADEQADALLPRCHIAASCSSRNQSCGHKFTDRTQLSMLLSFLRSPASAAAVSSQLTLRSHATELAVDAYHPCCRSVVCTAVCCCHCCACVRYYCMHHCMQLRACTVHSDTLAAAAAAAAATTAVTTTAAVAISAVLLFCCCCCCCCCCTFASAAVV